MVSSDHVHPHIQVSEFVKRAKGRSSGQIQQEFPQLKKTYWGRHFWARGYFSATSGNVTDDIINEYINEHTDGKEPQNISRIRLE